MSRIFKILPDKWQENSWNGLAVETAFEDLQEMAYKFSGAIEDMISCNIDDDTEKWLQELKEYLFEIDNAVLEYDGDELEGLVLEMA